MSEWVPDWWPYVAIPAIFALCIWEDVASQRRIDRSTRLCPTCGGSGRVNRDEVAG